MFGIKHYCTIGLNSREANNEALAEQVMEILPLFIYKEGVVGIGEIGFDDQTPAEEKYYRAQLELAKESGLPVQIHTPHRDKKAVPNAVWTLLLNTALIRIKSSSIIIMKKP
ncbi:TatD family hydrolase [Mucilaginibacter humi]|uniref:TatD family hydrolase n=1 Tax=Mucilaginibacter humi TaxID=2732510 RepID=UPI001FEC626C|nr:TatD family hydrolase [Mucilaginibacter humi]